MFSAFRTFGRMGAPAGRTLAQQIAAMSPSLWLEPSVTNGYQDSAGTTALTQPGGGSADPPVGKVLDLSGLGNHATQSTSTARPKLSARVNLLTYTEDFSNAVWVKEGVTVSSGVSDPWGTTRASKITETSTTGGHSVKQSSSGTTGSTYTNGAYLKAAERTWAQLITGYMGLIRVWINLETGELGTLVGISAANVYVLNAGNGWWKVSFTGTASTNNVELYVASADADNSNSYAGDASKGIYAVGAQIELGSTATAYQRVTDANTYAYAGWPLIHQFDGVDDVLNVTFPSSLGSDCTVVTANRGTTPTILTGQTIGTSYTINTTNAGRLVFPRALTAAETAIVTAWATKKGALP